ncbi:MAG: S1 RNA-binding domain-containing protein, partial [Actinomycetota bacterium]
EHVDTPESVLNVGDTVRVKVIEVDVSRRRISLSMRQVGDQQPVSRPEIEEEPAPAPAPEPVATADDGAHATVATEEAAPAMQAQPAEAAGGSAPQETAPGTDETGADSHGRAAGEATQAAPAASAAPVPAEEPPAAAEEDVSLESILEDLKRREGRSE